MTKLYRNKAKKKRVTQSAPPGYREVFSECGLNYGRSFGSKSGYSRTNPGCIFIANASVFTRARVCIWRGDLDLASSEDVRGLLDASRRLNRTFYVLREQIGDRIPQHLTSWFVANTIVTVWRGRMTAAGDSRCLRGMFSEDDRAHTRPARARPQGMATGDFQPPLTVKIATDRDGNQVMTIPGIIIRNFGVRVGDAVTLRSRGGGSFVVRFYRRASGGWRHLLLGGKTRVVQRRF